MENEEKTLKNEGKFVQFLRKWGWIVASGLVVVAFLFMLGPVVKYDLVAWVEPGAEEVIVSESVNVISYFQTGYDLNWTMGCVLAFMVFGIGCSLASHWHRPLAVAGTLFDLLALCFVALSKEFFASYENGIPNLDGAKLGWGAAIAIFFLALASATSLAQGYKENEFTVRDMAEDAILIAMAFGLNFLKIPVGATGGSINFQMLPLMIIALRRGPFQGFICGGIIYGLLTCFTDGWGFACYPFDYLIGFGSVAVMGFFRPFILGENQNGYNLKGELFLLLSGVLATFVRYVGSNLSSIVIYGYTLEAALAYNSIYIPLSGLISFAVLMAAYGPLAKLNKRFKVGSRLE